MFIKLSITGTCNVSVNKRVSAELESAIRLNPNDPANQSSLRDQCKFELDRTRGASLHSSKFICVCSRSSLSLNPTRRRVYIYMYIGFRSHLKITYTYTYAEIQLIRNPGFGRVIVYFREIEPFFEMREN